MKKNNQQGSALLIAIVCLVVALVGTVGWIFWQNFFQRGVPGDVVTTYAECIKASGSRIQESYPEVCVTKDGERFTNPSQKTDANKNKSSNSSSREQVLALKGWGVEIPLGDTDSEFSVRKINGAVWPEYVVLATSLAKCAQPNDPVIGAIYRLSKDSDTNWPSETVSVTVGDNNYLFDAGTAPVCSATEAEQRQGLVVRDKFMTLFKNLRSSD